MRIWTPEAPPAPAGRGKGLTRPAWQQSSGLVDYAVANGLADYAGGLVEAWQESSVYAATGANTIFVSTTAPQWPAAAEQEQHQGRGGYAPSGEEGWEEDEKGWEETGSGETWEEQPGAEEGEGDWEEAGGGEALQWYNGFVIAKGAAVGDIQIYVEPLPPCQVPWTAWLDRLFPESDAASSPSCPPLEVRCRVRLTVKAGTDGEGRWIVDRIEEPDGPSWSWKVTVGELAKAKSKLREHEEKKPQQQYLPADKKEKQDKKGTKRQWFEETDPEIRAERHHEAVEGGGYIKRDDGRWQCGGWITRTPLVDVPEKKPPNAEPSSFLGEWRPHPMCVFCGGLALSGLSSGQRNVRV